MEPHRNGPSCFPSALQSGYVKQTRCFARRYLKEKWSKVFFSGNWLISIPLTEIIFMLFFFPPRTRGTAPARNCKIRWDLCADWTRQSWIATSATSKNPPRLIEPDGSLTLSVIVTRMSFSFNCINISFRNPCPAISETKPQGRIHEGVIAKSVPPALSPCTSASWRDKTELTLFLYFLLFRKIYGISDSRRGWGRFRWVVCNFHSVCSSIDWLICFLKMYIHQWFFTGSRPGWTLVMSSRNRLRNPIDHENWGKLRFFCRDHYSRYWWWTSCNAQSSMLTKLTTRWSVFLISLFLHSIFCSEFLHWNSMYIWLFL